MAQESGEQRFFADCPNAPRIRVHDRANVWDLHNVAYTAANLLELEVLRLADWLIDVPLPGQEHRVLDRTVKGVRVTYNRLGDARPVQRFGELVNALQIPELSLGDTAVTYTAATGGAVRPGSGTLVRVNKLVDWTQHVMGDVDAAAGWPVARAQGLLRWRLPGRLVDDLQEVINGIFHGLSVTVAKILDHSITATEVTVETALNVPRPHPHRQQTVFARLPLAVYRAHEVWVRESHGRVYVGTTEELRRVTHADIFHAPRRRRWFLQVHRSAPRWGFIDRFAPLPDPVVVVTDQRTFASAPEAWKPYVVSAAWILDARPQDAD